MGVRKGHHLACSGAKIDNVLSNPQRLAPEVRTQLQRLNRIADKTDIDTVLLTLAGNDLGFASKIARCRIALRNCLTDRKKIDRELARVTPRLTDAYSRVYAASEGRRLAVVGYPDIIPNPDESSVRCSWLKAAKRDNIEYFPGKLDLTLRSAAEAAGAIYISVRDALRSSNRTVGHELCTEDSWMYPITPLRAVDPTRASRSEWQQQGHPTEDGQNAIAVEVRRGLRAWDQLPGDLCPNTSATAFGNPVLIYEHATTCETAKRVFYDWGGTTDKGQVRGNWRCRILGGTPNTDDVPEVRCENNGRIVRWVYT
jgi:hypothetical protein